MTTLTKKSKYKSQGNGKKYPECELWQLGIYNLSKIKLGTFGYINSDKRAMFVKNLRWLLDRYK